MSERPEIRRMVIGLMACLALAFSGCEGPNPTGQVKPPPKDDGPSQAPPEASPGSGTAPWPAP